MPKVRKARIGGHAPSVKLKPRISDVKPDEVATRDFSASKAEEEPTPVPARKSTPEKRKGLHDQVAAAAVHSLVPYSKSHIRRMKRRAREQLAGGVLDDLRAALADAEERGDGKAGRSSSPSSARPEGTKTQGLTIGEGRHAPLSATQRKRALALERMRHALVLKDPAFSSNPLKAIQKHASNVLVKRQLPSQPPEKQ